MERSAVREYGEEKDAKLGVKAKGKRQMKQ